jgi:hypothetical protein
VAQIARIHQDTIVDNLTAHAADVSDELNSLVNESNSQDTRITEIEGGSLTSDFVTQEDKGNLISRIAKIINSSTGSSVFTTEASHGITNGDTIKYALGDDGVIDVGILTTRTYYGRSLTLTTFSFHPTYLDAINGTNAIVTTLQGSGTRYLIGKPATFTDGDFFITGDGARVAFNGALQELLLLSNFDLRNVSSLSAPFYVSPTTFTVNRIFERDSGNKLSIIKSTPTTINLATVGLNGIAQSANLAGTASVISGSTAITFSTSQTGVLIPGDVITTAGGQARKLVSVAGTTAVAESQFATTEAAVNFKRGGRCSFYTANTSGTVGTCHYNLYAITDGTTPGLILSTRNVALGDALVDLPAGYIYSKIMRWPEILYNISTAAGVYPGISLPKAVVNWPYRPKYRITTQMTGNYLGTLVQGVTNVLPAGGATSYTAVDFSRFVPPNAKLVDIAYAGNSTFVALRPTGGSDTVVLGTAASFNHQILPDMQLGTGQSIDYSNNGGGGQAYLDVYGFTVTELA